MRTEFLFPARRPARRGDAVPRLPPACSTGRRGKPVTIRTLDAGGDKPVPGFTVDGEQPVPRPARHPPVAGAAGGVPRPAPGAAARRGRTAPEGDAADGRRAGRVSRAPRALFAEEAASSGARASPHAMPPLGIMVEVPAVAIAPEPSPTPPSSRSARNDLTQYVMAAARDNAAVAASQCGRAIRRCCG